MPGLQQRPKQSNGPHDRCQVCKRHSVHMQPTPSAVDSPVDRCATSAPLTSPACSHACPCHLQRHQAARPHRVRPRNLLPPAAVCTASMAVVWNYIRKAGRVGARRSAPRAPHSRNGSRRSVQTKATQTKATQTRISKVPRAPPPPPICLPQLRPPGRRSARRATAASLQHGTCASRVAADLACRMTVGVAGCGTDVGRQAPTHYTRGPSMPYSAPLPRLQPASHLLAAPRRWLQGCWTQLSLRTGRPRGPRCGASKRTARSPPRLWLIRPPSPGGCMATAPRQTCKALWPLPPSGGSHSPGSCPQPAAMLPVEWPRVAAVAPP